MAQKISVPAEIREQIHFDTLWEKILSAVQSYAGQKWTTLADPDPGITLLQALTYITSDLSYRHTLPLTDLLTPDETHQRPEKAIFAPEFGPETALTCGPVTLDDYRRAILDLHNGDSDNPQFYFRDVIIQRELPNKRYRYQYDADQREFKFSAAESPAPGDFMVDGGYDLCVAPNPGIEVKAKDALSEFLKEHRNLCEVVNTLTWLKPCSLEINLTIDLEDDFSEEKAASLMADVFLKMDALVSPAAQRFGVEKLRAEGLAAESIYQGPKLEHGWITQLPPAPAIDGAQREGRDIDLHLLAGELQKLPGIARVLPVELKNSHIKANEYPWVWRDSSGKPDYKKFIAGVKFRKRGQPISVRSNELEGQLDSKLKVQRQQEIAKENPQQVQYGRFRSPGNYYSAGERLPPCYLLQQEWGMLSDTQKDAAKQLYQFLLPFEQWFADGCDQLAKLPNILSFDQRQKEPRIWGGQWPAVADRSIGIQPKDALPDEEIEKLQALIDEYSKDNNKELSILDYLLGYFGVDRASRTLLNVTVDEFRAVQQGFLRQITLLAYERAEISVSKVSALQRRIAARLGVGQELFEEKGTFPKDPLPFYIIENRQLLPVAPKRSAGDWQAIKNIEKKEGNAGEALLVLTLSGETEIKVGQLIDLKNKRDKSAIPILANVIHEVNPGKVSINLNQHVRLRRNESKILGESKHWEWKYSEVWLKRESYPLEYLDKGPSEKPRLLINTKRYPYPADLKKGNEIKLIGTKNSRGNGEKLLLAKILDFDPTEAWIEAELSGGGSWPGNKLKNWSWTLPYKQDAFSFTLSVVLNRKWLDSAGDPHITDAWIRQIVDEEVPSHITTQIHWLSEEQYANFATSYSAWQKDEMTLGDRAYELLHQLSIGYVPVDARVGIGFTHIVDDAKKEEKIAKESKNKKTYEETLLFYVASEEVEPVD